MKDIKKIIENLLIANQKAYFSKGDIVTVESNRKLCLLIKNSSDLFNFEFGTNNVDRLLSALEIFEENEIVYNDPYITIKDTKSKSKFKFKVDDKECMVKVLENNAKAMRLFNEIVPKCMENSPYIKFKLDKEYIKTIKKISADQKIDRLNLKFEDSVLKLTLKDVENSIASSEYVSIIDNFEGKIGDFDNYIEMKFVINDDFEFFVFEDQPWLYMENNDIKLIVVYKN